MLSQNYKELDADIVIIGSGPAGSTIARIVTEYGLSVIIIEEGKEFIKSDDNIVNTLQNWYRDSAAMATMGKESIPLLQGVAVGGGSVINGAIQVRFPENVWKQWVKEDKKWERMLAWKELEMANDFIDKELSITQTATHLLGKNGGTMLKAFGEKAHPIRRNTINCLGSGKCLQGCPNEAKQSTDKNFISYALKKGATLISSCVAEKIEIKNGTASAVFAKMKNGENLKIIAHKKVVLAASAIQTPWLLLKSGIHLQGNGFMCHPGSAMMGLYDHKISDVPEATQSAECLHYLEEHIKFESLGMPTALKAARIPGFGNLLKQRLEKIDYVTNWGVACKSTARGKVSNGPFGPVVWYSPNDEDRKKILKGLSMMAIGMLETGAKEIWPSIYGAKEVITTKKDAALIAEMKPQTGMFPMAATHFFCGVEVDEKFQVKGLKNLIVADSSLFPSNIGVNPMSAIMSVAVLVAKRCV